MGRRDESGSVRSRGRFSARTSAVAAVAVLLAGLLGVSGSLGGGAAQAAPNEQSNLVTTLRCDSANPWPAPRLPIWVDVYNQIAFPSDGLPPPAIALIGSSRSRPGLVEYTTEVRVSWRNLRTGRSGTVTVPTRANRITWQVVLHPGRGPVQFGITQKIGAMAVVPMVNPQFSSCRGRATA